MLSNEARSQSQCTEAQRRREIPMLRYSQAATLVLFVSTALGATLESGPPKEGGPTREMIDAALRWIATAIEVTGVGIIVIGAAAATVVFVYSGVVTVGWPDAFRRYR